MPKKFDCVNYRRRRLHNAARGLYWLALLLAATGCAPKAGQRPTRANDSPRGTFCTQRDSVGPGLVKRLMANVAVPSARKLPEYVLPVIAGEVALRMGSSLPAGDFQSGTVSFTLQANGEAANIRVDSAGDAVADSLVLYGVRLAGSLRQFALQRQHRSLPPLNVQLRMWTEIGPENRGPPGLQVPAERQAVAIPGNPAPDFPERGRQAGVGDDLVALFPVNIAGRPDPDSFRMLKGTYREFVAAIVETLPHMRYLPAQIHGCSVQVIAYQPFSFSFRK